MNAVICRAFFLRTTFCFFLFSAFGANGFSQRTVIVTNGSPPQVDFPLVRIEATRPFTSEPLPNAIRDPGTGIALVLPGEFSITRTDPRMDLPLNIYLNYSGTAGPDDYEAMRTNIVMGPGTNLVALFVQAKADDLVEETETVNARLVASPTVGIPAPGARSYGIVGDNVVASVQIIDAPQTQATLQITEPQGGSVFTSGETIQVSAVAVDPNGYIPRVEFYSGERLIGVSEIAFIVPPEPGTPIKHSIEWRAVPVGHYSLVARAHDSAQRRVNSPPVNIFVNGFSELPMVGVIFREHLTREAWPDADFAPGSFEFFRTGATDQPLMAFFTTEGTAVPGEDYVPFPGSIVFAAGQARTNLKVSAIDDLLVEGDETVVVTLQFAPPGIDSPYITDYRIDLTNETATVTIQDNDGMGRAQIEITSPRDGQVFPPGSAISIEAVAVDPNGYIPRVEFFAGTKLIGVSEIAFFQAPEPGTPVHHSIVWEDVPEGEHVLTVVGIDSAGQRVVSNPVRIGAGETDRVVLSVETAIEEGEEYGPDGIPNPAMFLIKRVGGPVNEPVTFRFTMAGTAEHGVDYARVPTVMTLAAGSRAMPVKVQPIPDWEGEGDESVILTLLPGACWPPPEVSLLPFAPFISCYRVGGTNVATAVIHDRESPNHPPRVEIVSPHDGAVVHEGQPVRIRAEATDSDGRVVQTELRMARQIIATTNGPSITVHTNIPLGPHTFSARAIDDSGAFGESTLVRILVVRTSSAVFVERDLPAGFIGGTPFLVVLRAAPPLGTKAWGVEDDPPKGWPVSDVSEGSVLDPVTGKVKFGYFTEGVPSVLSYRVTPPASAAGRFEFSGTSSADGVGFPIGGDAVISTTAQEHHPADATLDKRISLVELTGYAAAWKQGGPWAIGPNPIPGAYVTRAAMIWRQGESYYFVRTNSAPQCWIPGASEEQSLRGAVVAKSAAAMPVRTIVGAEGGSRVITIMVDSARAESAESYAVEEIIPEGWAVSNVSGEGVFDPASRAVRWGIFLDGAARTLTYTLAPPAQVADLGDLSGRVFWDGTVRVISGVSTVMAEGAAELRVPRCERQPDGSVRLSLRGAAGQVCILEASSDLAVWTVLEELFLPDGELEFSDRSANEVQQRYYRLRVR